MRRTSLMKALEKARKKSIEVLVREARETHGSVEKSAVSLDVTSDTFRAWEKALKERDTEEARL